MIKEALQGPMRFPFQLFPPELLEAEFVSWLLSSGALTSSKHWRLAHTTHSFHPVSEPIVPCRLLLPLWTFKKVHYCPRDPAGSLCVLSFPSCFPPHVVADWQHDVSPPSLLTWGAWSLWQPSVESRQHPACFFRERGEAMPEGSWVKKV